MKHLGRFIPFWLLLIVIISPAQAQTPPDDEGGPVVVTGEVGSANFAFLPDLWPNPTVALMDVTHILKGQPEIFVPKQGKILGLLTEPLFPGPGRYRLNLPITPAGETVDVDNDGQDDAGVQIFALLVASNLFNDSYLEQLEQVNGLFSYLSDVATGDISEGAFLLYAPDGDQAFPTGSGEDGKWFTADDPSAPIAAGYTLARLGADGTVRLERSPEVTMNTLERAEVTSPDFSDQDILASYNALIDTLARRYAWSDLRGLDWEQIRRAYLPQVETAEANQDILAYYVALDSLANSIEDAHVAALAVGNVEASLAKVTARVEQTGGGVGASVIAESDEADPSAPPGDRILVLTVGDDTPAAEAGWTPGTEIVSIDGQPAAARYETLPMYVGTGVAEVQRFMKTQALLSFPLSQTVTIGYRLPDASAVLTASMVTGEYASGYVPAETAIQTPITYEQRGDYAIVR